MFRSIVLLITVLLLSLGSVCAASKPRIMVLIPEYHLPNMGNPDPVRRRESATQVPDPASETEIIKNLIESGFKVVDQMQLGKIRYREQTKEAINGDSALASKIGLEYGADIIIIGEAFSESVGRVVRGFESCRARVEARAILTDTAEIIAADGVYANGIDVALFTAGKKSLQEAGKKISSYFVGRLNKLTDEKHDQRNSEIELVVSGMSYRDIIFFKKQLASKIKGVKEINQQSFLDNRAVLVVTYSGLTNDFSEEIVLGEFDKISFEVTDISSNKITISANQ